VNVTLSSPFYESETGEGRTETPGLAAPDEVLASTDEVIE
jgi:hypothetical protein